MARRSKIHRWIFSGAIGAIGAAAFSNSNAIAATVSSTSVSTSAAASAEMDAARALMRDGQSLQAYIALEKFEFDFAGEVEFDTLLGIAALDAGKPDKATLAFERVLAVSPNLVGVRLDMGRAYFSLGDYVRARREFNLVLSNNPPPTARSVVDKYLTIIDERERTKDTVIRSFVESFVGYDNNITSVVGDFTNAVLATYNLAGFQPTGNAVKRGSVVMGGAGGLEVTHKVSVALSVFSGLDLRHRQVISDSDYSNDQLDVRAGVSYQLGMSTFRGSLFGQAFRQRTEVPTADRNTLGLNIEWRHSFGEQDQVSIFSTNAQQRFPDITFNNVNTVSGGIGWLHLFDNKHAPLLYTSLSASQDNARTRTAATANSGKHAIAARVYGQLSVDDKVDVFTSLGLLYRYDLSLNARSTITDLGNDHTIDIALGLNWRVAPDWTIRPTFIFAENRSNIALSEFKRAEATVAVRYDF